MRHRTDPLWVDGQPGWLQSAQPHGSPNFDRRPAQTVVDLLVVHHISLPPGFFAGDAVTRFFTNTLNFDQHPYYDQLRDLRVSSHFLITRHGHLQQFVSVDDRAWHAGQSVCGDRVNCNDFSVGVELQGDLERPFTDSQYRRLGTLTEQLKSRLPLRFVAGHSDIAPGRKFDPGPHFDWSRLMSHRAANDLQRVHAPAARSV